MSRRSVSGSRPLRPAPHGLDDLLSVFYSADPKQRKVASGFIVAGCLHEALHWLTNGMPDGGYTHVFTCGPEPMLKAVYGKCVSGGQFSFEERMGCGFGACMGCTCETKYGHKRICKDGPVLEKEEIIW